MRSGAARDAAACAALRSALLQQGERIRRHCRPGSRCSPPTDLRAQLASIRVRRS
jgi:hypothetical protein